MCCVPCDNMIAEHAVYFPFFEALADGIGISEPEGKILYLNPAAEGLLNVDLPGVRGKNLCDILCGRVAESPDGPQNCPLRFPDAEQNGVTYMCKLNTERSFRWAGAGVQKADKWSHVRIRCLRTTMPWFNGSDGEKHLTIIEDASSQVELERHKEDWRNMIAHDLRTPLTTVYANLKLLLEIQGQQRNEAAELKFIGMGIRNCERMMNLLNLYLEVAKLDAGLMPIHLSDLSLADSVNTCVSEQEALASENNIDISVDIPPDLRVSADAELWGRVLQNILNNALKFTPPGGGVRITARREDAAHARLSIDDDGPGIDPADRAHLFDRYHQAEARRDGRIKGIGLGLAFCKEALRVMGGEIATGSENGKGAQFLIYQPLATSQKPVGDRGGRLP